MGRSVVSIIDYRASKSVRNVQRLLDGREKEGKIFPRAWKEKIDRFKSLTIFTDGSCLLHSLTAASMGRRMKKGSILKDMQW